jgi:acetyltransferase-like isoleucine patch superfamily enzyme
MIISFFDCRNFLSVLMVVFIGQVTIAQEIQLPSASPRTLRKKARQEKIESYIRQQEEGALVFNKQSVFAFKLNTDGWSLFYEAGKSRTIKSATLFYFELGEKRHPKENKVTNTLISGNLVSEGNAYVYGKQNYFYECKPGFGRQLLIGGKANKNGIGIHWIYSGGLSIGDDCSIGLSVFIWSHSSHLTNLSRNNISQSDLIRREKTTIGNGVFIAGPSVILPGSTIGDNVVIRPFSTVTGVVPSGSLVDGKTVSENVFTADRIKRMLEKQTENQSLNTASRTK